MSEDDGKELRRLLESSSLDSGLIDYIVEFAKESLRAAKEDGNRDPVQSLCEGLSGLLIEYGVCKDDVDARNLLSKAASGREPIIPDKTATVPKREFQTIDLQDAALLDQDSWATKFMPIRT